MVQGPLLLPGHPELKIRKISTQLKALAQIKKSLSSEHAERLAWKFADQPHAGYAGLFAIPRLDAFGNARMQEAAAGWHTATGWEVRTGIRGIREPRFFNPEEFELHVRTLSAFDRLEKQQGAHDQHRVEHNQVRIVLVRATTEVNPVLAKGEFLFDLASHMWILATNPDWRDHGNELLFRCLAEKFTPMNTLGERAVLVGYRDSMRAVNFSSKEKDEGIVLIGRIPDLP